MSNKNELNELSKKQFQAIIRKKLAKDLAKKFSILNSAKYFSLKVFDSCLVFIPLVFLIQQIILL